jgi:hypothetical protein
MQQGDLERLIGYALLADKKFRQWLVADPQGGCG